jgi:formate dehydrogenase major subunit
MYSNKVLDLGTPARDSAKVVTLQIDGKPVTVPAGTSVLRAAVEAGVNVPKLCATDSLEAFGSCRLCVVEVEGRRGFPASCTTHCESGMKVGRRARSSPTCGAVSWSCTSATTRSTA